MTAETKLSDISEQLLNQYFDHETVEDGRSDSEEMREKPPTDPRPTNSTSLDYFDESLDSRLNSILDSAQLEHFENGFQSEFGQKLKTLIREDFQDAVIALSNFILQDRVHPEIAAEALKALGEIQDKKSHMYRRSLIERSLECSSAIVRDSAVDAIESLGDKDALGSLIQAATREQNTFVRQNLDYVIQELQQG